MESTIDSFPFYLASNACPVIYPNNLPTDFRTRLSRPLQLTGKWECGLKSIAYSSNFVDKKEKGEITCAVTTSETVDVNALYGYEFKKWSSKWIGLAGVQPNRFPGDTYEDDPKNWQNVLNSLNRIQDLMITTKRRKNALFEFSSIKVNNDIKVIYKSNDPTFAMRITERMSRLLGFFPVRQFEGSTSYTAGKSLEEVQKENEELKKLEEAGAKKKEEEAKMTKKRKKEENNDADNKPDVKKRRKEAPIIHKSGHADNKVKSEQTEQTGSVGVMSGRDGGAGDSSTHVAIPVSGGSAQLPSTKPAANSPKHAPFQSIGWLYSHDYHVKFFSSNVQKVKCLATINLKKDEKKKIEPAKFAAKFCKVWTEQVSKQCPQITAKVKGDKIVIRNDTKDNVVKMSRNLMYALTGGKNPNWVWTYRPECPCVIFSHGVSVEFDIKTFSKVKSDRMDKWVVSIFSTVLDKTKQNKTVEFGVEVRPWHCKDIVTAVTHINEEVKKFIRGVIPLDYSEKDHAFDLKMISPTRAQLTLGDGLTVKFDANLSRLFGISTKYLTNTLTYAEHDVDDLTNHRRILHVLTNVIAPTSYGEQQRRILRGFLHKGGSSAIIEKEFQPIMYHPLVNNCLDVIHVEMVSDDYSKFTLLDSDTIIVLHFRRVE